MDTNHKSLLREEAAHRRRLPCRRLSYYVIAVDIGSRELVFQQFSGPSASSVAKYLCDHKQLAKGLLSRAGVPTNPGRDFALDDDRAIAEFADSLDGPVVIKPSSLSKGRGVTVNVTTREAVVAAADKVRTLYCDLFGSPSIVSRILVEQQFQGGEDFRFFVVGDEVVSITRRSRAQVRGDGRSTVLELIREKNQHRSQSPYYRERLIPEAIEALSGLKRTGLGLDDAPAADQQVPLQDGANVSLGGETIDVTEDVHPSYKDLAVHAIRAIPGMEYGGVDVFIRDHVSPANSVNCAVSEVEFSPAPTGMFPTVGTPRDIAGAILEFEAGFRRSVAADRDLP